jgi:hypothetical protein
MTASEAFNGLITIVGSGGLVTILIALLGYKREAEKGRPVNTAPVIMAGQSMFNGGPQAKDIELLTQAVTGLTGAILRQVALMEESAERREREREFRMWLNEQKGGRPTP